MLRALDFDKSFLQATLLDELKKCGEEDAEFLLGVINADVENTIEEFWDSVQVKLNVMDMIGIDIEEVYQGLDKHIKKMSKRGYVFKR